MGRVDHRVLLALSAVLVVNGGRSEEGATPASPTKTVRTDTSAWHWSTGAIASGGMATARAA